MRLKIFLAPQVFLAPQTRSPQIEAEAHQISGDVMSPFCPGRSLNDCPSSSASDLRNQIAGMLETGKTKEEVFQQLYSQYGDGIRAMPKHEGFGLVGWISPFVFVLLGLVILSFWLKRHRSLREPAPQTGKSDKNLEISSDMRKRIEEEVYGKN